MNYTVTVAPTDTPVTVADANLQVSVDGDEWSTLIGQCIAAATLLTEQKTGRALATQTRKAWFQGFDRAFYLPGAPIQSVSGVVANSSDGTTTAIDLSGWHLDRENGYLRKKSTVVIPQMDLAEFDAVEITYICGYGAATTVPQPLKQAILLLAGHWFRNREAVTIGNSAAVQSLPLAMGYETLIGPYVLPTPA